MSMDKEKQKVVIVAVLGVVVLGVGAFQFMGGGAEEPKKVESPKSKATDILAENADDPLKEELKQLISGALAQRDPFEPRAMPMDPTLQQPAQPKQEPQASPSNNMRSASGQRIYKGNSPSGIRPFNPQISGLPDPSQSGVNSQGGGNVNVQPGTPLRQPGEVGYNVAGVLVGKKPMAVLQDDSGQQHLVPVGGNVGGDTEIVAIERGKVTVRHKGKIKVLKMEGGASRGN